MTNFMNRYFSIVFLFVVAFAFVACNYEKQDVITPESTLEFAAPDSTATLPFEIDSIKTVSQLLDSLAAVQVD
jgi:hypothetical protein